MDSSAEGSSPVEPQGGDVGSLALKFPSRLFTANSYPTALHLNIYWKANVIGAVAACLQGSPDMDILLPLSVWQDFSAARRPLPELYKAYW